MIAAKRSAQSQLVADLLLAIEESRLIIGNHQPAQFAVALDLTQLRASHHGGGNRYSSASLLVIPGPP